MLRYLLGYISSKYKWNPEYVVAFLSLAPTNNLLHEMPIQNVFALNYGNIYGRNENSFQKVKAFGDPLLSKFLVQISAESSGNLRFPP